MTKEEILNEILPGLADGFEAGNQKARWFSPSSAEEFEPLRECAAELVAEGSARSFQTPQTFIMALTAEGYRRYKPLIDALRSLPRQG